jgi:hypothetical protein
MDLASAASLSDLAADLLLDAYEIKTVDILTRTPVSNGRARLKDMVRLIAGSAAFLGRRGDGEPGVKTLRLGPLRVMDFTTGIKCAHALQDPRGVCNEVGLRRSINAGDGRNQLVSVPRLSAK